jgi:diguanylate cyclase (GGDEF)-like protein
MAFYFKSRLLPAYLLTLLLGVGLLLHVLVQAHRAGNAAVSIAQRDLVLMEGVGMLRHDVREQEAILYAYYVTRNRGQFVDSYAAADRRYNAHVRLLSGISDEVAELGSLRKGYGHLYASAKKLDSLLTPPAPATDQAHLLLEEIGETVSGMDSTLRTMGTSAENGAEKDAARVQDAVRALRNAVYLLAGGTLLAGLFIGYRIHRYLAKEAERISLAMFPERNPNAVMRLSKTGKILYANPATASLLDRIGAGGSDARALLPPGLTRRLAALRKSRYGHEVWAYSLRRDYAFECGIHWLPDLDVFHLYISDVTERKRAEEQAIHQAYHDALSDLPNRRMFQEQIQAILYAPDRAAPRAAVLLVGLDRFKVIVDSLGHGVGDELLRDVGIRIGEVLVEQRDACPGTILYHFGGDLYCILVPAFTIEEVPVLLAEHVTDAVHRPFYVSGRELNVTASTGISVFPLDGQDGATLLRNADIAMHRVKKRSGDGLQCYTRDMNERAAEWLELENELRHAEDLSEFRLYYHPQLDTKSGRVVGMEALLRWQHPRRGLLAPPEFLHLAEESGLISPIGDWILREACRQTRAWQARGLKGLTVAVNISARQFAQEGLAHRVAEVLQDSDLSAESLELEITEGVAMQDVARTTALLHELKEIGVRLSVDDFGTGFSSLSYLKRFPIDKLKIDQSFVRQIATDENDAAIVRSVITLGHSLGLRVTAEGVESPQQLQWLQGAACDEYQGYLAAPPLPPDEFERFVDAR